MSYKLKENDYRSDLAIKKLYKRLGCVYPKNKLKRFYDKNTLTMDKKTNPNNSENRLKFSVNPRTVNRVSTYHCKEVICFDSETLHGKCKLLARSSNDNDHFSKKNWIINPSFDECLEFLCYHIDGNSKSDLVYRFFYNIDFDVQAILKLLPEKEYYDFIDKLSKGISMEYKGSKHTFKLKWIRSKFFSITVKERKRSVFISDLYTFYKLGLGTAGQIYANDSKLDDIDGDKLNTLLSYWNRRESDIIRYCIQDCNLTKRLAEKLIESIEQNGLLLPKHLVSPASLSKQYFRKSNEEFEYNYIPTLNDTPIKITQIAYDSYYGGRFEVLSRGFHENGYLYDISSQYPTFIRNLPDMFNGLWIVKKNLTQLPEKECLGYFKCVVDIPYYEKIPTLPQKRKNGLVSFSNGTHIGWYTWYDLDLMRDYITKIQKAYIFEPNDNNFKPFKERIDKLYSMKQEIDKSENPLGYRVTKITMNGLYGCFIERQERYYLKNNEIKKRNVAGNLFNPIYASQITAFGRWSVVKDVPKDKQDHILAIHTDSIITDKPMDKYLDIGHSLGKWELEVKGKTVIIGTGMYQIGNLVKSRGIPKKLVKNWFKLFEKNGKETKIPFTIKHMKKIRECIVQDESFVNMNKMSDVIRTVHPNSDSKRCWIVDFNDFSELLNRNVKSYPFFSFREKFELDLNPIIVNKCTGLSVNDSIELLKELDLKTSVELMESE